MDGSSKKGIQEDHHAVNRDADPSQAIEYHQEVCQKKDSINLLCVLLTHCVFFLQGQRSRPFIGYQHRGRKKIAARGKCPLDINNNPSVSTDGDGNVEKDTAVEQPPKAKRQKTGSNEVIHSRFTFDQHLPKFCCQVA